MLPILVVMFACVMTARRRDLLLQSTAINLSFLSAEIGVYNMLMNPCSAALRVNFSCNLPNFLLCICYTCIFSLFDRFSPIYSFPSCSIRNLLRRQCQDFNVNLSSCCWKCIEASRYHNRSCVVRRHLKGYLRDWCLKGRASALAWGLK